MKLNGIKIPHMKNTSNAETIILDIPKKVKLSLGQHIGAACESLVKVGEQVYVGQKIGESENFVSTPLHSSVSGKVTAISDIILANGKTCKAIEIETDGLQTVFDEIKPPVITDKNSFIEAVKESGCCGLGGAGFPTHIKLNFDPEKNPVDSLIINAAECEPYITSDYREIIENTKDVVDGIKLISKILNIPNVYIGIEDNKPKAIELLKQKFTDFDNINVVKLKSSYPQGAEKVLVYSTTGRIIEEGQLPLSQNVIVLNVSTASFINKYINTGMPLISKRITVDGDNVKNPCNIIAPIGTPITDIMNFAKTNIQTSHKIISGGMMMGMCIYDINSTITKTNNAIISLKETKKPITTNCIKCGNCMRACPFNLMPMIFEKAYDNEDLDTLKEYHVTLCMNCGSCSYVCPANRNLAEKNQLAKQLLFKK